MFSCEPDSTSCSMMLASRSRSNSAVVSARSMLWVSSISLTVAPAVFLRLLDRVSSVAACSSFMVRLTAPAAVSPALLIMRAISAPLSSTARLKVRPFSSIARTA